MLSLSTATRIFVALEPVDMRQNFNGLYARVQSVLQQDPLSGHFFVFTNRSRTVWICVVRITGLKLPGDAGSGRIFLLLKSGGNLSVFHLIGPKIAHFCQKFCSNRSIFVNATLILERFYLVDSMQYFLCPHFDQARIG